jgi:hypothetical protein
MHERVGDSAGETRESVGGSSRCFDEPGDAAHV